MIYLIKDIEIYSPKYLGKKDLLFSSSKIEGFSDAIDFSYNAAKIINGEGKILFPGFIDSHVHVLGGGGEGGFCTRTQEIFFSELINSGITTVVGCLGTDGVTKSLVSLLCKCKELRQLGINAFMYTGSYKIPPKTITRSIQKDIVLFDEIIGVGEIAISDHRSSEPTFEELTRCISDSRIGGIISGKAGITNIHIGSGKGKLDMLFRIIQQTDIPLSCILPTHINRNKQLFLEGMKYVKSGGYIDITTSSDIKHLEKDELLARDALKVYVENNLPIEQITFSSDGNGSLPIFGEKGELIELGKCKVSSLYEEVKQSIKNNNVKIEDAIKVITSNVADRLKLNKKGYIKEGYDSDLVMVDKKSLDVETVFVKGQMININKM